MSHHSDEIALLDLLNGEHRGVLVTIKRDGRPQLSNVDYTYDPASGGETLAATINALTTSGAGAPIIVLAVSISNTTDAAFCETGFLDDTGQATAITGATGGVLFQDVDEDAVGDAIAEALDAVEIPVEVAMESNCESPITTNFERSKAMCRSISGRVPLPIEPKPIITIGPSKRACSGQLPVPGAMAFMAMTPCSVTGQAARDDAAIEALRRPAIRAAGTGGASG